jgi:hypothetical protein
MNAGRTEIIDDFGQLFWPDEGILVVARHRGREMAFVLERDPERLANSFEASLRQLLVVIEHEDERTMGAEFSSVETEIVLVPRNPTKEMIEAAWADAMAEDAEAVWKRMVECWLSSQQRKLGGG